MYADSFFSKEKYFTVVRVILMLLFSIYGLFEKTGVSVMILLLVLLYITVMSLKELTQEKHIRIILMGMAILFWIFLMIYGGSGFILMGVYLWFEFLYLLKARPALYLFAYSSLLANGVNDKISCLVMITLLIVLYMQHEYVVEPYKKQMYEDTVTQQDLKRDIQIKEYAARAALSQTLHDKLGHSINGSIYQLEASKVIMDNDPQKARDMIQAVIDQLRNGMDEIRAILRKERPEKKKMAILQLHELCADCNDKGVEAELETKGDTSVISDELWEVILDNAFEAVTNSMKYSKCKRIKINILVMNKMVKCSVSDDGIGCEKIEDGMGLSGMRKRVRNVGGIIDFEAQAGFEVNMLFPIKD